VEGTVDTSKYTVFEFDEKKKKESRNSESAKRPALLNCSSSNDEEVQFDQNDKQETKKKVSLNDSLEESRRFN
jgi:hypothetical protein